MRRIRRKALRKLLNCLGISFLIAVDGIYIAQPAENFVAVKTAAADPVEIALGAKRGQSGEYRNDAAFAQIFYCPCVKLGEALQRGVGEVLFVGLGGYLCPVEIAVVATELKKGNIGCRDVVGMTVNHIMAETDGATELCIILYAKTELFTYYIYKRTFEN